MLIGNVIVSPSRERQINIYRRWGGGDGEEDFGFATIRFTRSPP